MYCSQLMKQIKINYDFTNTLFTCDWGSIETMLPARMIGVLCLVFVLIM